MNPSSFFHTISCQVILGFNEGGKPSGDIPLQRVLDEKRSRLEEVVSESGLGRTWLEPCARTSDGTSSFLKQLESRVNQDAFLDMLHTNEDGTCVPDGDERTAVPAQEVMCCHPSGGWLTLPLALM
eukprot:jgi/Picre1/35248/NNA_002710.t1